MQQLKPIIEKLINEQLDILFGGKSDNMSLPDIARKHKISLGEIEKQLEKGIKIELEHTNDKKIARKIAMDHLVELPDYYTRLMKMEKSAEKK